MKLVEHDTRHVFEERVVEQVPQQDAGGDGDAAGVPSRLFVEADVVTEAVTEAGAVFVGHPPGGGAGGDSPGFEEEQLAGRKLRQNRGGYAGGFARTGRCPQDDGVRLAEAGEQLRQRVVDGKSELE